MCIRDSGLVHISQITDRFIKHPLEAVSVGDIVDVKVLDVDPCLLYTSWRFATFLSFFPNIMSGPIERGDHFLGQLREITKKKRRGLLNYDRVMQGLIAMLLGYGMKLIVAQRAEILVNQVYSCLLYTSRCV